MELATFLRIIMPFFFLLRQLNELFPVPIAFCSEVAVLLHRSGCILQASVLSCASICRCHGMFRWMQAVNALKQPCSGTR